MAAAYRTAAADEDLFNIAYHIGVESGRPSTADRIVDELIDCCDRLAETSNTSRAGTAAERIGLGIRLFHHRRWVIFFRYTDEGIIVLRFADGSQDYLSWRLAGTEREPE
jgi:plasmid stabilization system protein ParE